MKYENYVFDLYGTLVDIRTDEDQELLWSKLALFYGYYGAHYTPDELKEEYALEVSGREKNMKEEMHYAHEAFPEIKLEYVFQALYQKKGIEASMELSIHTGQFFRVLSTEYVRLYPGTEEMLAAIKQAGKKIYLLSNAQRIFTEYELNRLDIMKYFDGVLISSEEGCKKPDINFFELLRERFQIDYKKSLMIGNDMRTDIGGAKNVGMDTFYIHSNISPELSKEPSADYVLMEMDMKKVQNILMK